MSPLSPFLPGSKRGVGSTHSTTCWASARTACWDDYIRFFALGLQQAAENTRTEMVALSLVQSELKERPRPRTCAPTAPTPLST